jgi:hypothetical protein
MISKKRKSLTSYCYDLLQEKNSIKGLDAKDSFFIFLLSIPKEYE